MGKKAKRAGKKAEQAVAAPAKVAAKNGGKGKAPVIPNVDQKARKEPKTAVVTASCPPSRYEETMREARVKLNLNSLGITGVRIKKAITGALIFEIPGKESAKLADTGRQPKEGVRREEGGESRTANQDGRTPPPGPRGLDHPPKK